MVTRGVDFLSWFELIHGGIHTHGGIHVRGHNSLALLRLTRGAFIRMLSLTVWKFV